MNKNFASTEHENLQNKFIEYLITIGIPKRNIVSEWGGRNFAYDVVILDETLTFPLYVFEIKIKANKASFLSAIKTLKKATLQINTRIKLGIVCPSPQEPYFSFYDVTDVIYSDKTDFVENPKEYEAILTNNDYLSSIERSESNINILKTEKENKNYKALKCLCWKIVPISSIVLILLDRCYLLALTSERLIVYGVCILLVLLPFLKKISIGELGIVVNEFEKDEKNKEEN